MSPREIGSNKVSLNDIRNMSQSYQMQTPEQMYKTITNRRQAKLLRTILEKGDQT